MNELSANTTLSHYRIVSKIGAGGMARCIWLKTLDANAGRLSARDHAANAAAAEPVAPRISAALDELILRLLKIDPSQRPTASEVANALQERTTRKFRLVHRQGGYTCQRPLIS